MLKEIICTASPCLAASHIHVFFFLMATTRCLWLWLGVGMACNPYLGALAEVAKVGWAIFSEISHEPGKKALLIGKYGVIGLLYLVIPCYTMVYYVLLPGLLMVIGDYI